MRRGKLRTVLRLLAGLVGIVGSLLLLAILVIYVLGERLLERDRDFPVSPIAVVTDAATLEEGERLATITGCRGCHRPDLSGGVFFDGGILLARVAAPNLSVVARDYTDEQLAHTIRYGVRPDGRAMVGMPSAMFYHLTDADLAAIIAYVRSVPEVEKSLPKTRVGPMGRLGLLTGDYPLDAEEIASLGPRRAPVAGGEAMAPGRYVAQIACTECHGMDLRGHDVFTPSLAIAAAYDDEQFRHFMRTGEALGGRELGLMSSVARNRFAHLTDDEVGALHQYLRSLGDAD
ncbi:MAG TPA: cytochrome c [Gammaproteobacteria bacterium]|nr:cytochrome c [Gammaproteobacteria bacterium]